MQGSNFGSATHEMLVIANLLFQFFQWFEEFMVEQWDKKIEAEILTGRLDKIAQQVDDDFNAGCIQPL